MTVQPASGSKRTEHPGFLLDLITGTDTEMASVQRLADAAALALTGSAGTGIDCAATMVTAESLPVTAGNTSPAANVASSEDRYGDGPMEQAAATGGPVVVTMGGTAQGWQAYRRRLTGLGYGGALAVPLELKARTTCTLVFLGPAGFEFTPELVGEATWLARVASSSMKLALEVRSVRSAGDNLKTVLESRTSIDVACGVIMAQNRCSYSEAFSKLAGVSRQRNLKVRSVAENILKAMAGGSPGTRFEPPVLA
ncbi:ANTAR domain-containing protein [Arthrobacter sp. Cr_A7]|uniref:ANTAR domain-containing protein n=1 Tax=Arthrobacter sp. Cr_A7 TaxID=3031017 RepID=UPI0023DBA901|nr:ANTAR domain-containing protein [Arthrobacter sp. Cr_A7]MDF2048421.1 ANTAR domain-containing protein [Arthrobacter sp. Cr_A7]